MRSFVVIGDALGVEPTLGIFFSFYESKGVGHEGWISLADLPGRDIFHVHSSNFKNYKDNLCQVRGGDNCCRFLSNEDDSRQVPFYWMADLVPVRGFEPNQLSDLEWEVVEAFCSFGLMMVLDILDNEEDPVRLWCFMGKES